MYYFKCYLIILIYVQAHFAVEMWEKPRIDGKKKLKNTAVPTIFSHKNDQNIIASNDANNIELTLMQTSSNVNLILSLI